MWKYETNSTMVLLLYKNVEGSKAVLQQIKLQIIAKNQDHTDFT